MPTTKSKRTKKPVPPVRLIPLDEIEGWADNPRNHDLNAIGSSMKRFGYVEFVATDSTTGKLVAGHGRVEELRQLRDSGAEPPEDVHLIKGAWHLWVREKEFVDEKEARAYVIASNRTHDLGEAPADEMGRWLMSLDVEADDDLVRALAYDEDEFAAIIASAEEDASNAFALASGPASGGSVSVGGYTRGVGVPPTVGASSRVSESSPDSPEGVDYLIERTPVPDLKAPFPYFGGKRRVVGYVWTRFGEVKQYLEPFCGSATMLLGSPGVVPQETIGDQNLYVANFWRSVKCQPDTVAEWCDYPVVHIDLTARHRWLCEPERVAELREKLMDPEWPGDTQMAGWWCWGQSTAIGDSWASGHIGVPESIMNRGIHNKVARTQLVDWMSRLSERLRYCSVINASWNRCCYSSHNHAPGNITAFFLDPPYKKFEKVYRDSEPVAAEVEEWCRENGHDPGLRIALCGHVGDYDLPGWEIAGWSRDSNSYGSDKTKDAEAIWFSPACLPHQASE